jgi:DNA-binding MarR family transcriptional regulator
MIGRRTVGTDVRRLLEAYPRIYFACHTRHVRDPGSGAEVSRRQAQILDHLDAVEPVTVTALATHLGVTASTMSLAIDRLEGRGFVRRVRDADDGRRVGVITTPEGQRMQEAHSVLDAELVRALLTRLSAADRARALEGLELLAEAASRHTPATAPGAT